jgi:hypothetical protein
MIQDETLKIGNPLRTYMEHLGWVMVKTHGNQFQKGLPDFYAMHHKYSPRWIETKIHGRSLTPAQLKLFPIMLAMNVPLWIIDGDDFRGIEGAPALKQAYAKLFQPSRAAYYLTSALRGMV